MKICLVITALCILAAPQCPDTCSNNNDCLSSFCSKNPDNCAGFGICLERPVECDADYSPVCGCDGQSYSNQCAAAAAGVSVAHIGECLAEGACLSNQNCDSNHEYCSKDTGSCEGPGSCKPIPEVCIEIYAPVCGCDQKDYPNDCHAFMSAVNVLASGTCENTICQAEECGPQLGMPNYPCQDGTIGGPTDRCLKSDNGTCGWEIRDCKAVE